MHFLSTGSGSSSGSLTYALPRKSLQTSFPIIVKIVYLSEAIMWLSLLNCLELLLSMSFLF